MRPWLNVWRTVPHEGRAEIIGTPSQIDGDELIYQLDVYLLQNSHRGGWIPFQKFSATMEDRGKLNFWEVPQSFAYDAIIFYFAR